MLDREYCVYSVTTKGMIEKFKVKSQPVVAEMRRMDGD